MKLIDESVYCVIEYEEGLLRKYDGRIFFCRNEIPVPLNLIMITKYVKYADDIIPINNLKQEFKLGSRAVVLEGQFAGSLCNIVGNDNPDESIRIEIQEQPLKISEKFNRLIGDSLKTDTFYKIRYVADTLKVLPEVIYQLLDSVIILVDNKMESSRKIGTKFDLGLNIINRKKMLIVSELARCSELGRRLPKNEYYDSLELSHETVQLITAYKNKHGQIFKALEEMIKKPNVYSLKVENIFKNSKDPNVELIRAYIWLIKEKTSHLLLYNLNSIVMSREKISNLQDIVTKGMSNKKLLKDNKLKTSGPSLKKQLNINPNFLHPENQALWIQPFFNFHPDFHCIGDRVINLRVKSKFNQIPFGKVGTVIGVVFKKIEIVFDEAFIGGTNLGGRCKWLHGALVDFLDVFNITAWSNTQHVYPRVKNNDLKIWMANVDFFYPTFQSIAISNEEQQKKHSKNIKDPFLIETEFYTEVDAEPELQQEEEKENINKLASQVKDANKIPGEIPENRSVSDHREDGAGKVTGATDNATNPVLSGTAPDISKTVNPIPVSELENLTERIFQNTSNSISAQSVKVNPITVRELEVSQGLSISKAENEIAERSPPTIQAEVKLGQIRPEVKQNMNEEPKSEELKPVLNEEPTSEELKPSVNEELKTDLNENDKLEVIEVVKPEVNEEVKPEVNEEVKPEVNEEKEPVVKEEVISEVKEESKEDGNSKN